MLFRDWVCGERETAHGGSLGSDEHVLLLGSGGVYTLLCVY